jgi:hypothetical protein
MTMTPLRRGPHKIPIDMLRKPRSAANDHHDIWVFLKNERCRHLAILGAPGSGKTTLRFTCATFSRLSRR